MKAVLFAIGLALAVLLLEFARRCWQARSRKSTTCSGDAVGVQVGEACPKASTPRGLVGLFESNASEHSGATALTDVEAKAAITYGDLAKACRALEVALRHAGLGGGDALGVLLEPSCCFVVATMGAMQAGICWIPLDPKSPSARLQDLLDRAGARLALAAKDWAVGPVAQTPVWALGPRGEAPSVPRAVAPPPSAAAVALAGAAAVFFTSGSTGEPKGVIYRPETLCHGALTFARLCSADSSSTFLVKTPTIWAVMEYEVFTPLAVGACAVVDACAQRDPLRLAETIRKHSVSILVTSGPVLQLLLDERLPSLCHAVNVGAALPLEVLSAVHRAFGPGLSVHNLYGCTETPCLQWSSGPAAVPHGTALAPAGVPQPGVDVHLLDAALRPAAVGSLGEIYIGGPYLSLGYLGDERLTRERFLPGHSGRGRIYRTGDLGRWLRDPQGRLVLQVEGRLDRQLNIRGVRVAPEEIEAVLSQAPGVREIAVVVAGGEGAECLVACIAGEAVGLASGMERRAESQLPPHMRPAGLLLLDALPRLGNGKIDLVSLTKTVSVQMGADHNGEVEALNSLGQMRKVKRELQQDMLTMASIRMWAMVAVVLYHWYWEHWVNYRSSGQARGMLASEWRAQGSPIFRAVVLGLFGEAAWTMPAFVTLSGYSDSVEGAQSKLTETAVAILLLLACHHPLPDVFLWVLRGPLANADGSLKFQDSGHRWYLVYYIACNLLHTWLFLPLRAMLAAHATPTLERAVPAAITVGFCVLASFLQYHHNLMPSACGTEWPLPEWKQLLLPWVLPSMYEKDRHWYCNLFVVWQIHLFPVYAIAWWYGPPLVRSLREAPLDRWFAWLGPLLPASLYVLVFGVWQVAMQHFPLRERYPHMVGTMLGYLLMWVGVLLARKSWYPLRTVAWLGSCSLTTYILHIYLICNGRDSGSMNFFRYAGRTLIPPPEHTVALIGSWPGSDLAKLLALLLYPVAFMATFGQAFQALLGEVLALAAAVGTRLTRARPSQRFLAPRAGAATEPPRGAAPASPAWGRLRAGLLDAGAVVCLDGGTGSELERRATREGSDMAAVDQSGWSCLQWKTHPELLRDVHQSYLRSGAGIIIANSYATNRHIMKAAGFEDLTMEGTLAAVRLAREARDGLAPDGGATAAGPPLVAGSMSCHPPGMAHGASMDKGQWPPPEVESAGYVEQAGLLRTGGADLIFVEMIWEWNDHGLLAARGACASGLPVALCLAVFDAASCEEGAPQLHDGTLVEEVAKEVSQGDGWESVAAICVHHTKLPLVLPCLLAIRRGGWRGVVGAYPDHGTFVMPHWRFEPLESRRLLECTAQWVEQAGCQLVGGCCGIGPEAIRELGGWCRAYNARTCRRGRKAPAPGAKARDGRGAAPAGVGGGAGGGPCPAEELPVLVLGAGLSGLAAARECQKRGCSFVVVDRQQGLGGCWRSFGNKTSRLQSDSGSYDVELEQPHCLSSFPPKDELLAYVSRWSAANGLDEHTLFSTELLRVEPEGAGAAYSARVATVEGAHERSMRVGAVLAATGRLHRAVRRIFEGESDFQGCVCYGISDDLPGGPLVGAEVAVLGHGSFALENVRTSLEGGATQVTMICRRRNLILPRAVRLMMSRRASGERVAVDRVLDLCRPAYRLAGLDCRDLPVVCTLPDGSLGFQGTVPPVSDLYFLALWSKSLEVVVDSVSHLTATAVCTEAACRQVRASVIVKCLGFEAADPGLDRVLGLERMVGMWVNGDPGRFVLHEPAGKLRFDAYPIPQANPHFLYLFYFFRALRDGGFLESAKGQLPTGLTCAYDFDHTSESFRVLMGTLDSAGMQDLTALADRPAHRAREAHPWERFLAEQRAEWEAYSEKLGVQAPEYPYSAEWLKREEGILVGKQGGGQARGVEVLDLRSAPGP